jgi:hypothetical protein
MKSKEALEKIGSTTYYDWSNVPLSEHFKEEFDTIKKSLTELEELKRDVKRYFELDYKLEFDSEEEAIEWRSLYYKLLKVGNEE